MDMDVDTAPPVSNKVDWTPTAWEWDYRDSWRNAPSDSDWQKFMNYWMEKGRASAVIRDHFPHELEIFPNDTFPDSQKIVSLAGATPLRTTDSKMMVLERHAFLYSGLQESQSLFEGAIIGGQPGIGKSVLLWYFLVRLIHDEQPVMLHLPEKSHNPTMLFYKRQVWYPQSTSAFFELLPVGPLKKSRVRKSGVWKPTFVLVDSSDSSPMEPLGLSDTLGWPIYAVSPHPPRFKKFMKYRQPVIWGLDLWTTDQLRDGLKLHTRWPEFHEGLYALKEDRQYAIAEDFQHAIEQARKVIENEKYKDWPKDTVDEYIEILLDNAIHWYGYVPRQVFPAIFALTPNFQLEQSSTDPLDLLLEVLAKPYEFTVYKGWGMRRGVYSDPFGSHKIITLRVAPESLKTNMNSRFELIIGSPAIHIDKCISEIDIATIRHYYQRLMTFSHGAALAGHIFAEYAIGRMKMVNPELALKPMDFRDGDANQPTFSSTAHDDAPDGVYPDYPRPSISDMQTVSMERREWYDWNYKNGPLQAGFIYVPPTPNHAFFVQVPDPLNPHLRVLWVIQFTTSWKHGGGFANVQKLLKLMAKDQRIQVQVRWVLLTPTPAIKHSDREWQMPPGWNEKISVNDHRGYVWLQEMCFV